MLPPQHPFRRAQRRRAATTARSGGFSPVEVSAVSAWLRLANGTIDDGYSSVPDVLASNPATQAVSGRQPGEGASANGLPIATLTKSSPSQLVWPVASGNNSTAKWGFAAWVKMTTNSSYQCVLNRSSGAFCVEIYFDASRRARVSLFGQDTVNYNGRDCLSAINSLPATGTWFFFRFQFDGSQGTEALRCRTFVDEAEVTNTFSNVGTGGTPVALRVGSGNVLLGNYQDNADTTYGLDAAIGPNVFILSDSPTAAQGAALRGFEQPT